MKKEWCKNYSCGQCKVEGSIAPSLAQAESKEIRLEPERRVLSDRNSILNFLYMFNKYEEGMVVPEEIVVTIPNSTTVEYLRCTASNSRSKQRQCDHFSQTSV